MSRLLLAFGFVTAAATAPAVCRYTVRDIGFVDLSGADYALRLHAPKDVFDTAASALKTLDPEATSNLRFERVVSAAPPRWSLACDFRPELTLEGIDVTAPDLGGNAALQRVVESRVLREVSSAALSTFAFALVIESTDHEANAALHKLVADAEGRLNSVADQLPRSIDWPLQTVALEPNHRDREEVLLWALGLSKEELGANENALALVYGRGKLAGPVLTGEDIELREVLAQLVLIGESCECDTNRAWAAEPRLPLTWNDEQRASALANLGFDPDSPMVRGEVLRILARGPSDKQRSLPLDGIEGLLFGYQETDLASNDSVPARGGVPNPNTTAPNNSTATVHLVDGGDGDWGFADEEPVPVPEREEESSELTFSMMVRLGIGLALLIVLGGAVVLVKRGGVR